MRLSIVLDDAVVQLDNAGGDGQAQAGSIFLGGKKRVEQAA